MRPCYCLLQIWTIPSIAPIGAMLHDMAQILGANVALSPTKHGAKATAVMSLEHQIVVNDRT